MCEMRLSEKFYTYIARGRDTKNTRSIITLVKKPLLST